MVDEFNLLSHPILVHLSVLVPDISLWDHRRESSSRIEAEVVWIELDRRSICGNSSHLLVLQQMNIGEFDHRHLHVIVAGPEVETIYLGYFAF